MRNTVSLKIQIEGKEANAAIELTNENIRNLYKSFKYGKQHVNGLTTQISSGFNNAREILIGVRETAQAINSLWSKPIQARVELEQAQVSFKVLLGDAEQADKRIKELYNFTATTPFQLQEVISASRKLEVLTQGALSTGKGLRMVGDVASGVGVNINELSTWFGRLYDGIKSGRPVGEALMRLQELGVLSGDVRGKIEGLTKAGADNAEIWKVVTEAMKKFDGMMEEQADTLGGKLSNLEDNVTQLYTAVGGGIGSVLSPLIEHLNGIMSVLNSSYPIFTAVAGGAAILSSTFLILNTTGILPVIKNLFLTKAALESGVIATMKQSYANTTLATTNTLVGKTGLFASRSMTALKAAFGPWGLALVGFTILIEALGLLGDEAEETTKKVDELQNKLFKKSIPDLDAELAQVKLYLKNAEKIVDARRKDLKFVQMNGKSLKQLRYAQNQVKLAEQNLNNLRKYGNELLEERKKKLKEMRSTVEAQYKTLQKRMEVDEAKTDKEKNFIRLKQDYEADKLKITRAYELGVIKSKKDYYAQLDRLHEIFIAKTRERIKKTPRPSYTEIGDLKVKDYDNNLEKTTELTPVKIADDFRELQQMKFSVIEDGYAREEAIREANHKADLKAYSDIVGAKEIIDNYYRKEKERADRASAIASFQSLQTVFQLTQGLFAEQTAMAQGLAVAQVLYSSAQAQMGALEPPPTGLGPVWGWALLPVIVGQALKQIGDITNATNKVQGYALGGRFRKGESGFIEGYHNEIIAPEKTFVEVFRQELRPQIYNNTSAMSSEFAKEMKMTREAVQDLKSGGLNAYISERDFNRGIRNADAKKRKSRI